MKESFPQPEIGICGDVPLDSLEKTLLYVAPTRSGTEFPLGEITFVTGFYDTSSSQSHQLFNDNKVDSIYLFIYLLLSTPSLRAVCGLTCQRCGAVRLCYLRFSSPFTLV